MRQSVNSLSVLLLVLIGVLMFGADAAYPGQDLTATWLRQKTKTDGETDQNNLNYTMNLAQDLTERMALSETFRYTRGRDEGRDTEVYDPSLRFSVNNDLFLFNLLGAASKRRDTTTTNRSSRSWDSNWTSNWQKRFWPSVRLSYGQDWSKDDESPHREDKNSSQESASVDWDLELFKTYYSYNRSLNKDLANQGESESTSHFAKFSTGGLFFEDRLNVGLSQQYSTNTSDTSTAVGSGGTALVQHTISQILVGKDDTPLDITATELTNDFSVNSLLHNGDDTIASGTQTDGFDNPPLNIPLKVDFNEVDLVYLYTVDNEAAVAGSFTFDLYTSNNLTDWQLLATGAPFSYNSTERRFEFNISPQRKLWLKVVVTNSPIQVVEFSEIEIYNQVAGSGTSVTRSSKTTTTISDLNMGYKISPTMNCSYSISMEDGGYSSGVDYTRRSQAGNLRWDPWQYLSSSFDVSETRDQNGDEPENLNRSYGMNLSSPPIPTVDVNLGLTRTDQYEGDTLKQMKYDAGLFTSAQLYPDLDGNLDLGYIRTKQEDTGNVVREYDSRLALTARLIPGLTADLTGDYRRSKSVSASETLESTLNLNWRTSDMLSLVGTGRSSWRDGEKESEAMGLNMSVAPTETVQMSLGYDYSKSTKRTNKYTFFLSWALGPHFTFQGDASYTEDTIEEDWLIQGQLVARFSTR